jgi:hypothetical protein
MTDAPIPHHRAPRKKRTKTAGAGCFVQGLGLVLFGLVILLSGGHLAGIIVGVVLLAALFVAGSSMSRYWSCGRCGTQLAGRDVSLCPSCHAELF